MEKTARQSRRWKRWFFSAIGALMGVILIATALQKELRDTVLYAVAPSHARNLNFVHFKKGQVDVYVLGTIHGRHLSTDDFSLNHLRAVLSHLRPDSVLLEMRPEEIAKGRWGDGPVETPFVALTAKAMGIRIDGIDWRNDDARDDHIFQNLIAGLPVHGSVLVLIGYSHVPEQAERLARHGFEECEFPPKAKAKLFVLPTEPFHFPAGMKRAIQQRIEDSEAEAAKNPAAGEKYRAIAANRRAYLVRNEQDGEFPEP